MSGIFAVSPSSCKGIPDLSVFITFDFPIPWYEVTLSQSDSTCAASNLCYICMLVGCLLDFSSRSICHRWFHYHLDGKVEHSIIIITSATSCDDFKFSLLITTQWCTSIGTSTCPVTTSVFEILFFTYSSNELFLVFCNTKDYTLWWYYHILCELVGFWHLWLPPRPCNTYVTVFIVSIKYQEHYTFPSF